MTHPGGRPLKFSTPEILQDKIDAYFDECDETKRPYTVTGLAVHLDVDRSTLIDYTDKPEFSHTIKRAKDRIEARLEESLYGNSVTGLIFNLKNNYKWVDKHETEHTGTINYTPLLGGDSVSTNTSNEQITETTQEN